MPKKRVKNQHVIPRENSWAVIGEGNERITSTHNTQVEAMAAARRIAQNQRSEVVIHRADGRIRERSSYGNDPQPARSPRKVLFPITPTSTSRVLIKKAVREVTRKHKILYVLPQANSWAVQRYGHESVTSTHDTKAEAVAAARKFAQNRHLEVVIRQADGHTIDKDIYLNAPNPAQDKKR